MIWRHSIWWQTEAWIKLFAGIGRANYFCSTASHFGVATAHSMWTDDPAFNLSIKNHARLTQAKQCLLNCSTGKTGKVDNYTNITQRKNYMFCRSWERLGNFNTPQQTNKILCCTSNNWTKQLLKRILTTYMWKNHCMDVFQNKCEITAWTFSSSTSLLECFVLSFKQF